MARIHADYIPISEMFGIHDRGGKGVILVGCPYRCTGSDGGFGTAVLQWTDECCSQGGHDGQTQEGWPGSLWMESNLAMSPS